jgi:hypothetical protein
MDRPQLTDEIAAVFNSVDKLEDNYRKAITTLNLIARSNFLMRKDPLTVCELVETVLKELGE